MSNQPLHAAATVLLLSRKRRRRDVGHACNANGTVRGNDGRKQRTVECWQQHSATSIDPVSSERGLYYGGYAYQAQQLNRDALSPL
jgi:hypothetical protein